MLRKGGVVSLSLRLVDETADFIVGEDAEGDRRRFPKDALKGCIFERSAEAVTVMIERSRFRKLKVEKADISPAAEKAIVRKKRRCLNCRHTFEAHPSTFVCTPCKKTQNWRTGADFSLAS